MVAGQRDGVTHATACVLAIPLSSRMAQRGRPEGDRGGWTMEEMDGRKSSACWKAPNAHDVECSVCACEGSFRRKGDYIQSDGIRADCSFRWETGRPGLKASMMPNTSASMGIR
jgi:hypothetical protein